MPLLEIEELRVRTRHKELVHGIDLDIEAGEWLAVVGESGSGKSLTAFSIAWDPKRRDERAAEVLEQLKLPAELLRRYPFQVSGGQLQRAALAAAILLQPRLIIADEPTTALDAVNASLVLEQIAAIQEQEGCAVLFITHNLRVLSRFADRMVIMQNGEIKERGATREIFESPQEQITRNLIAAIPPLRDIPARLPVFAEGATS